MGNSYGCYSGLMPLHPRRRHLPRHPHRRSRLGTVGIPTPDHSC